MVHSHAFDRTGPDRVLFAMLTGAANGGLLVAAVTAILMIVSGAAALAFWIGLLGFVFATPIWFLGIAIIGGPVWWVLHRVGLRSRLVASVAGGVLVFLVVEGFFTLKGGGSGGREEAGFLVVAVAMAAIGAGVGWTVAGVAYRSGKTAR